MSEKNIHLITGGQRSGKSEYGEKLALELDITPTYLATSKIWDDEYQQRIEVHKQRRSDAWLTIEEELHISKIKASSKVLFVDCITLWLANVMDHFKYDPNKSLDFIIKEWDQLIKANENVIAISNEIGMGVIPIEKSTRQFVDLQGKTNQFIAQNADQLTFMVSGLPLKVK